MIGSTEVMVIGGVVVLLFGASAIPKLARSLGQAKKEFKEGMDEVKAEAGDSSDEKKTEE